MGEWKGKAGQPVKAVFLVSWLLLITARTFWGAWWTKNCLLGEHKGEGLSTGAHPTLVKSGPVSVDIPVLPGCTSHYHQIPAGVPGSSVREATEQGEVLGIGHHEASHCQVIQWEDELSLQQRMEEEVGLRRSETVYKKGLILWYPSLRITEY